MATIIEYPGSNAQAVADLNAKLASLGVPAHSPIDTFLDALYTTGVAIHSGGYESTAAINAFDQIEAAATVGGVTHAVLGLYEYGFIL